MTPRFCTACGSPVEPAGRRWRCGGCGRPAWNAAGACAGVLITSPDRRILLARRARAPFAGWWDIVGGFLNGAEHPEEAARREAREETGLSVRIVELLAVLVDTYGTPDDYTLNFHYLAASEGGEPHPQDDVAELQWFAAPEIPFEHVAFHNGREALRRWARKISA
ncbi:MAG: NUDIX domain-containing protein [Candidatus Xenobia bacterium]